VSSSLVKRPFILTLRMYLTTALAVSGCLNKELNRLTLGSCDESLARRVVHDEIKEPLSVALFLILETKVLGRQHAQARREQNDFPCEDGKLAFASLLRVGSTGESDHSDYVAALKVLVLLLEGNLIGGILKLTHDLHGDTLLLADVKLRTIRAELDACEIWTYLESIAGLPLGETGFLSVGC
jgi:hypothetical protein